MYQCYNFDFEPGVEKVLLLHVGPVQSELVVIDVDLSLKNSSKLAPLVNAHSLVNAFGKEYDVYI